MYLNLQQATAVYARVNKNYGQQTLRSTQLYSVAPPFLHNGKLSFSLNLPKNFEEFMPPFKAESTKDTLNDPSRRDFQYISIFMTSSDNYVNLGKYTVGGHSFGTSQNTICPLFNELSTGDSVLDDEKYIDVAICNGQQKSTFINCNNEAPTSPFDVCY